MTVTFCGQRSLCFSRKTEYRFERVITELAEKGASRFLLGGYGDFDVFAAQKVYGLKKFFPHICMVLVIPYLGRKRLGDCYDEIICIETEPMSPRKLIKKRNEYMIENSDVLVTYSEDDFGDEAWMIRYAEDLNKQVINLAENI